MEKPKTHTGFTLLELLVVIAIISILASLLYPVLASVIERGRRTQCRHNLRSIGTAMMLYSQDNNELFPKTADTGNTGAALGLLFPRYTDDENIFHCRSHAGGTVEVVEETGLLKGSSYCYASYGATRLANSKLEIVADRDILGINSNHRFDCANVLFAGMHVIEVQDKDTSDESFDMEDGDDLSLEDDVDDSSAQNTTDGFFGPAE